MVAQSKHRKAARRAQRDRPRPRKIASVRLSAPPPLTMVRPAAQDAEAAPREEEEPKPEDLAKEEEALKSQEQEERTAAAEREDGAVPRSRERSSYDGDTAIK